MPKQHTNSFPLSKKELYWLYVTQRLSQSKIAEMYNVGQTSVSRYIKKFGIPPQFNLRDYNGKNNPNWRGGCTQICEFCGESFDNKDYVKERRFCSKKCYGRWLSQQATIKIICKYCGEEFEILCHDREKRSYCSVKCWSGSDERKILMSDIHSGKKLSIEHRRFLSVLATKRNAEQVYTSGKSGYHESPKAGLVHYRSSYEKRAYELLDGLALVKHYKSEPFVIEYKYPIDSIRRYVPDILVQLQDGNKLLLEIKPMWKLKNAQWQAKMSAALVWCERRGMEFDVWTEKELWPPKDGGPFLFNDGLAEGTAHRAVSLVAITTNPRESLRGSLSRSTRSDNILERSMTLIYLGIGIGIIFLLLLAWTLCQAAGKASREEERRERMLKQRKEGENHGGI